MKSLFKKHVIPAALIVTIFASNFLLLSVPRLVHAEGGGAACAGGAVVAIGTYAWAQIVEAFGVPGNGGKAPGDLLTNRQSASSFINDCILKPLAQMMVVALIRNIGASIVNWVNTGFEGKPSFVTDFEGTLLNAADQAAGNFIESNTDLGFLCSPFSFQIRLALALKYSQPFNQQVRCTLTDIGNNIDSFASNNGGRGWDNWLKLSAEPQNNVYGAYLIADSELAQRMANAVDKKEKRISLGQGFLDFETCDVPEDEAVWKKRVAKLEANKTQGVGEGAFTVFADTKMTTTVFDSTNIGGDPKVTTETVSANTTKRLCKEKSVKTPGRVIADQLQSEFASGPIQRAVAQEIDQVISATLNQLAQKAIQGASGLLGLSQKRSSNNVSYIDQYRAKFYGQTSATTAAADTGAQSELDAYTVASYNDALALRNDPTNADIQNIDQFTNTAAGAQIQDQTSQFNNTISTYGGTAPEKNVGLAKMSTQSSVLNPASNGNDGIKQLSQYTKGAETSPSEAGGWWEVDLGADVSIKQINIYPTTSPSAPNGGLGTFVVEVKNAEGSASSYPGTSFTQNTNSSALTGSIGRTGRYVRITRQASETMCQDDYFGDRYSSSPCVDQPHLAFAELEVIETPSASSTTTTTPSSTTSSGVTPTPVVDTATATSTLSWNPQVTSARVTSASGINQEIQLLAGKSVSGIVTEIALYNASGNNIPFSNVFTNFDVLRGPTGGSWVSSQSVITPSVGTLRIGLSINQNSGFSFKITGSKRTGVTPGNYSFVSRVSDSTGTVLEDKTQRINFVVE